MDNVKVFRVEGGTSGSIHRRGPWYYATEAEAQAVIEKDQYPSVHPAAGPGIRLGYDEVELTKGQSALLRSLPAGRAIRGNAATSLPNWCFEQREVDWYPYHATFLSDLAVKVR